VVCLKKLENNSSYGADFGARPGSLTIGLRRWGGWAQKTESKDVHPGPAEIFINQQLPDCANPPGTHASQAGLHSELGVGTAPART
jgi:hypothetical protein